MLNNLLFFVRSFVHSTIFFFFFFSYSGSDIPIHTTIIIKLGSHSLTFAEFAFGENFDLKPSGPLLFQLFFSRLNLSAERISVVWIGKRQLVHFHFSFWFALGNATAANNTNNNRMRSKEIEKRGEKLTHIQTEKTNRQMNEIDWICVCACETRRY